MRAITRWDVNEIADHVERALITLGWLGFSGNKDVEVVFKEEHWLEELDYGN